VEQGIGEVVEGALTAVAPVAFAARPVVVRAPQIDVVAVAPGTLQWAIFPSQSMDIGLAGFYTEQLVYMREEQH
jgi:hypothetical protein